MLKSALGESKLQFEIFDLVYFEAPFSEMFSD